MRQSTYSEKPFHFSRYSTCPLTTRLSSTFSTTYSSSSSEEELSAVRLVFFPMSHTDSPEGLRPPASRDRDRPLTLTSPLFFCGETTSHCRCRLLRNAKRPPKRILPCASHPAFSAALLGLRGRAICPAVCTSQGSLGGSAAKNRLQRRRRRSCRINPWVGKIPWRRAQQPTPLFLPAESHGQRSLAGHSP